MPVIVLTLLLLLLPASAAAQVYKCKGKSGETAYSESPCDARAQPMKLRDEPPAAPSGPAPTTEAAATGEVQPATPASTTSATEQEAARAAERSCIANVTASIYGPSNDRVSVLQQQLSTLNDQLTATTDPQRTQALRTRMGTLRQAITREHGNAHTQMNDARRRCAERHRPAPPPVR
ncbi:DUF4124 domain-containing protein [Stenotrophomonas pictorum]|jgi:hypothetical protein|nr:DUF4124 domain-containing protein [Stenotrophomonas pictorum]